MKSIKLVKITTIAFLSFSSLSLIIGGFFITKASTKNQHNNSEIQIITDISQYQKIRQEKWQDIHEISHFPTQIPQNTQNIQMAYSQGLTPESKSWQIRIKKPQNQLKELLAHYKKISQHQFLGGDTNQHLNQPNGVPTTFFYTNNSQTESFPNTYQILVLQAKDKSQPGFKWNHGDSYGVAIDITASEIIYWVEKW